MDRAGHRAGYDDLATKSHSLPSLKCPCSAGSPPKTGRLALRPDERPDLRVGLVAPPTAMKHPIMADLELKVVDLFHRSDPTAELVRCDGLARRADIVPLALNRHQRGAFDGGRLDATPPHPEAASRQIVVVKYA